MKLPLLRPDAIDLITGDACLCLLFDPNEKQGSMSKQIQAGTIMVQQLASLQPLGIESEPYSGSWRALGALESSGLDRKLRDAGWNLFFMAEELRAVVPAWGGPKTLRRGVNRLLAQTGAQHFNCMELTHVLRKRYLGIPYVSIAAHSRHIQPGSHIESIEQRKQNVVGGGGGSKPIT